MSSSRATGADPATPPHPSIEGLGVFYLGNPLDTAGGKPAARPLLYQSKDLVTHAVCVGMTGSGKTGLCIGLLEEAALDGIPALAIDPKGDLSNLLLTFPALQPADFRPWINEDEARTKGLSPDDFAAQQASAWRSGLQASGQDGDRIQRLKDSVEFTIYTPGSSAGVPLSILKSFDPPAAALIADRELFRDRISNTVASLLALVSIDADPLQSREHVLLSNIFDQAWSQARSLDLASLIAQIQHPPFQKAGVLDLETFYPAKDRFALAMAFNNLLASPAFETWLSGPPLDIGELLHNSAGKPRISILSISHLSDAERMFFVALLLNQVLGWVRAQPGTSSLRALLYMDEIFGYFPPVANPPSKKPLLTLLKQARASGLGIVLATQNPVDLDYKGLSNTGTWFIGRLQTERDKLRVLDGLEGAAGDASVSFDRSQIQSILSGLASRTFLLNNVHDEAPQIFRTRWTLSYLRGPLTRDQIHLLAASSPSSQSPVPASSAPSGVTSNSAAAPSAGAPLLPPGLSQYFLPVTSPEPAVYHPVLIGAAQLHYLDDKQKLDELRSLVVQVPFADSVTPIDWTRAQLLDISLEELEKEPAENAAFSPLPETALKPANYVAWNKALVNWLFQTQTLTLFESPALGLRSHPGETERDFRIRLQQAAREERDRLAAALRQKYAPRTAALEERKRRAQLAVEQQRAQQTQSVLQTAVSVGTGLLSAFMGRKTLSVRTVSNATSAVRQAGRTWKESQDVTQAADNLEQLSQQAIALEQEFTSELAQQQARIDPATETLETVSVRLKKSNIAVQLVSLAWSSQT